MMLLFLGQYVDHQVLGNVIEAVCEVDNPLVLRDRYFLGPDDSLDDRHDIFTIQRGLQQFLIPRQFEGAWNPTSQNLDSLPKATRVLEFEGDLFFERFLYRFGVDSV